MSNYFGASLVSILLVGACSGGSGFVEEPADSTGGDETSTSGLGKVCGGSGQCSGALVCHVDNQTYVGDGQCTAPCSTEADCQGLGAHTLCIGAGICVRTCDIDSDCPASTRCGSAGWCERTGPGSGHPYCAGTPTPCQMLTGDQCILQHGCEDTSTCSGTVSSGSSAAPCSSHSFDLDCNGSNGCTWTDRCSGTVQDSDCSVISPGLCRYTAGCALMGT